MVTQAAPGALGGTFCIQFQTTRLGQGQRQQLIHGPLLTATAVVVLALAALMAGPCCGEGKGDCKCSGAAEVRDSKGCSCCPPALPAVLQGTPSSACGISRDILHSCFRGLLPAGALFLSSF